MAETDAGKVREALVHLTTQYQSQQIDAANYQQAINSLKGTYAPLRDQITSFDECYDYYTELDPCLEAVQLGKTHVVPPQPLTDKEIFFRGMYPHIKSPEEKKAFRELIQFSDEHKIPYTEYFKLLKNVLIKYNYQATEDFEVNIKKEISPQALLLQSILYAAMYALSKAPPLTTEQLAIAPEGLKLYYHGYEQTVLGHIKRWEIKPTKGNVSRPTYSNPRNELAFPKKMAFPSLFSPDDMSSIYHELFHGYQDSQKIYQSSFHNELHASLVGVLSVIRIEEQRTLSSKRSPEALKEMAVKSVTQKDTAAKAQLGTGPELFDSYSMVPEKLHTAFEYTWDWAFSIMEARSEEFDVKKRAFINDFVIEAAGLVSLFLGLKSSVEQQIFGNLSRVSPYFYDTTLKELDEELIKINDALDTAYTSLGINPSIENKDAVVLQKMEELKGEFIKDDGHFYEMTQKHKTQLRAFINDYYMNVTAKEVFLRAKIYLLTKQGSSETEILRQEYIRYKHDVVEPLARQYIAVFQPYIADGVE